MTEQSILELIFQTSQASINVSLIIILLAIGYVVKHAIPKINNDNIPWMMLVAGIVLSLIINIPYGPDQIVTFVIQGIVSGAAAIGLHTNGKSLLEVVGVIKSSSSESDTTDDNE